MHFAARLMLSFLMILTLVSASMAQSNYPPPRNPGRGNPGPALLTIVPIIIPIPTGQTGFLPPDAPLVTSDVPFPLPRPEFREQPLPTERPLLSLGRPALLSAEFEANVIVLLIRVGDRDTAISDIASEYGLTIIETEVLDVLGLRMVKYAVPSGQTVQQTAAELAGDPRVVAFQPNYFFEIAQDGAAQTNMRPLQYAPEKIHLVAAHLVSRGEGVTVGIIDTAIDSQHPEFGRSPLEQFDVLGGEIVSRGHGTAMSGLIVANLALEGVAPDVRLVSIRAFDVSPSGSVSSSSFALAKALDRMASANIDVLNLSFAGPRDPLILKVMDRLEELDIPVIAAAGNNGPDADPVFPAAHRHAIAVTATDTNDAGFAFSNLGMYLEVAAPGVDILSPQPNGTYDYETGTSAATAQVTGIVALMLSRNPNLTTAEIRLALAASSRDLGAPGRDEIFGVGLVDAALAVAAVTAALP